MVKSFQRPKLKNRIESAPRPAAGRGFSGYAVRRIGLRFFASWQTQGRLQSRKGDEPAR
jgi:hypothetical protein